MLLIAAIIVIVRGKQYTFDHAYDSETKYEAPSVHFENLVGQRYECIQDIQRSIIATFKPYIGGKELIGYADPAINSNLGDQLLWAGSNKLFQRFGKKAVLHCGGSQSKKVVNSCLDEKSSLVKTLGNGKGVLWFNPGGNWGDMYRNIHNNRLQVWEMAWENKIPFISGPQSIWYDPDKKKGVQVDNEIIESEFVYIFTRTLFFVDSFIRSFVHSLNMCLEIATKADLLTFRQKDSYQFAMKHYGNFTNVVETPDISFMLGPLMPTQKTKYDVFVLMRVQEQNISDRICKGVRIQGYHCAYGDWGYGTNIERMVGEYPPNYAEIGVQMGVGTISLGEVIVTDRLQAVILGFLAGKNVLYVDTTSKKIGNVLSTAFEGTDCINVQKPEFGLTELITTSVLKIVETAIEIIKTHGKGR